jgi:hypothetical protein
LRELALFALFLLLPEKMVLKITSVLVSGRIQALRCKDLVKVKFVRRGTGEKRQREAFPVPLIGNGSKDSKWWSPTPAFILESGENTHGQR